MIVESRKEIDQMTFERLSKEPEIIDIYGEQAAINSCFHPDAGYGYYGSRILYDEDGRYYIIWKRRSKV